LAFFFKQVCRVEDPRFDVKLKKTEQRVPVVLSTEETSKLFDHMGPRYELAGEKPERCDVIGGMGEDGKVAVEIIDLPVTPARRLGQK